MPRIIPESASHGESGAALLLDVILAETFLCHGMLCILPTFFAWSWRCEGVHAYRRQRLNAWQRAQGFMAQFIEFVGNNWLLSTLWVGLAIALVMLRNKTAGESVSAQQAVMLINRSNAIVVDIRDKKDFDAGHIVDAIHIPLSKLGTRVTELDKHKDGPVIVACRLGPQSVDAVKVLRSAGFTQVLRLSGGMTEWRSQGLPLVQ